MRTAIYARFSSDNQREESITAQVRACVEYAERKGYTIVKTYSDEAKSATTDDRPEFLRMIRDAKAGLYDVLLIHKLDRFARNRFDSAFYKRELRIAGVQIESIVEHLDDSPESVILESVLEGIAEYYSKNLAREVMKGMNETALQGKHTGGTPPLGYDVDPDTKELVINETEAKSVRLIFEMYDQGAGYNKIIQALNDKGYKTKRNKPLGKNSLHEILKNKKYCGIYTFNRSASKNSQGKRNHHSSKGPGKIIEIPGRIPQIIPTELFERIQAKMEENKQNNAGGRYKAKVDYLLSGKIWCGHCGYRLVGMSSTYRTRVSKEYRKQYYYMCNYSNRTDQCTAGKIRKETAENFVMNELEAKILNDQTIPVLTEKIYAFYCANKEKSTDEIQLLEKEISKLEKQIRNIVDVITDGGLAVKSLIGQLRDLEAKKDYFETQLTELRLQQKTNLISKEAITSILKNNQNKLKDKDPETCKQLIGELVDKIIVKKDTVEITFKVSVDSSGGGGGI